MVKYTLLLKPTVSGWPTVPRQVKTIIFVAILITLTLLVVMQSSRNARLAELYNLQASVVDLFDLEIKYMDNNHSTKGDTWKPTAIPHGNIFSAYLDMRPEIVLQYQHTNNSKEQTWAEIRVIAILPLEYDNAPLICYYKYTNSKKESIYRHRPATRVQAIKEHWNLKYAAFFVLCDLTLPRDWNFKILYNENHLPAEISIGSEDADNLKNADKLEFVPIHYPREGIMQTYLEEDFMAACVPVFHHNYDRATHLVEFIEYNLMMGVQHFTFYNDSVHPSVSKVFEHYQKEGVATIIQWQLPSYYIFEQTLRVNGIFAALNDCLYRNSFYKSYKYVLGIDVDEFIVPRVFHNFRDMMAYLDPVHQNGVRNKHASYLFRNVFFYLMYDNDKTNRDETVPYLYTQAKTQRVISPNGIRDRSKYIVRSQDVVELNNHAVYETRPGSSIFTSRFDEVGVDPEVAIMQHYRACETDSVTCYLKLTETDITAHRFIGKLGNNVRAACRKIFGDASCPKPEELP